MYTSSISICSIIQIVSRRPTNYLLRLPNGWQQNMAPIDREWVGRTLFVAKGKLTLSLKLWLYPPPVE